MLLSSSVCFHRVLSHETPLAHFAGSSVLLESVLHSMDGLSTQAKSKIMITGKVNSSKTIAGMDEQRKKFNRRVAQMVEVKAKVKPQMDWNQGYNADAAERKG